LQIDHYSVQEGTFQQRYLINAEYWGGRGKPIFVYTGNEGDITWFCNNTGFMWDIAPMYSAMLVFVEHRYYGQSMPFGVDSFRDLDHLKYLTTEQALADFAVLITALQNGLVVSGTPKNGSLTRAKDPDLEFTVGLQSFIFH